MINIEHHINYLEKEIHKLHQESMTYRDYINTVSSPLRKRLWWWIGGYYLRKVGRWYSDSSVFYRIWFAIAKLINCT
jgi:hypothetical protein